MSVVILGQGAWGNALYSVMSNNTKDVRFWDKKPFTWQADYIVLAIPTEAIRSALSVFGKVTSAVVINSSKGIEQKTNKLPYEILRELFGQKTEYISLLGPSFASEVIEKMPTQVNLAYFQENTAKRVQNLFTTDYFSLRLTPSIEALELASAFKNIYAIACGISQGLGFGMNTRAKIIALALEELKALCDKLEYEIDESSTIGFIGDLVLSCNSEKSRNFTFGTLLANQDSQSVLATIGATVEGYSSSSSVGYFAKKTGIQLPVAQFVSDSVKDSKRLAHRFSEFMKML